MKKRLLALCLSLSLCVSLLPAALAEGGTVRTYAQAVAELQSEEHYETEQSFDTDYGTIFLYNHGVNPAGQHGFLALVTKAPCAKGEGQIIGLPQPRDGLMCFVRPPHQMELSADKKTFTYSYHYDDPVISGAGSVLLRPAGDFLYTVDLTTGEVETQERPIPAEGPYAEAVKALNSGTGHVNRKVFDTPECTIFFYDRGGFMNAPTGALSVIYKAGSALGEGTVIDLPHVASRLYYNGAPNTVAVSEDRKTFTYAYFFPEAVVSQSVYGASFEPGTYTYTVDLATGTTTDSYAPLDYGTAFDQLTRAEGYFIDQHLDTPNATVLLRHQPKTWWVAEAGEDQSYGDYEMYLILKGKTGEDTVRRLLLPSTAYNAGNGYAPTDRVPDSLTVSEDGDTLTYVYSFDAPLTNGDTVYHEAGTYEYTVDLTTGQTSVAHLSEAQAQAQELAEKLKSLGLFLGDETGNFDLDRKPSRIEALVMLIRALGEEKQAKAAGKTHPFTDVPAWADGYVSWGYARGYTNGVSATEFGANSTAGSYMYLTFMLRALGWSDKDGDFAWGSPYLAAQTAGILPFETDYLNFTRAGAVLVTSAALFAPEKNFRFQALHERLEEAGAFTPDDFKAAFPQDPFAWQTTVERKVNDALDKALGVGQTNRRTALVQSHAILDAAQDGALLTIRALVCKHSLTSEELNRGEFGSYYSDLYVIEMQKAENTPGAVLRCEKDEETAYYWDDPQYVLFRDDLETAAQGKMTDLIASGTVQFRGPNYEEAVAELRGGFTYNAESEKTFETDGCTVFLYDRGGAMHTGSGYIDIIYKPGSAMGDGFTLTPPTPGNDYGPIIPRTPDHAELSGDKRTFTYSYRFDTPLEYEGRIIRPAGDFVYTVDLATGKVTEDIPPIPEEANTYAASLERVLAGYAGEGGVVEKTIEAPLCTLIFYYFQAQDGTRSYWLDLVYKANVDVDVSGNTRHTPEGTVKNISLPITNGDGSGIAWHPVLYTARMPDSMGLSEDGSAFTLTYNESHYGSPYTQTIDLKTGLYEGK